MPDPSSLTRRRFLRRTSAAVVAASVVPSHVLGAAGQAPPSDRLNVAIIGTGGQGITNLQALLQEPDVNITALCDVAEFWDNTHLYYRHNGGRGPAQQALKAHLAEQPKPGQHEAAIHVDFRTLLERMDRDIDAVLIAAPNHVHAVASITAMRAGKGVYCEKPLTHSIHEAREVARVARETGVATQMGNQGHSTDDIRRAVEWVRDGAIGKVHEVHAWRGGPNKPMRAERPTETPSVPEGLRWDLWLGPAKERPFHPEYAPQAFHYWWDFGSGTLGNFGCHTLDTPVWALDLQFPTLVEASSSPLSKETTPAVAMYHYVFPARGEHPKLDLYWYDGGLQPPRPDWLEAERDLPKVGGSVMIGDKGAILSEVWSRSPRIIPEARHRACQPPAPSIPRSKGHHRDWINACKGGPPASSNFENAARLTEIVLLGAVAMQTGATVFWDGPNMTARNLPEADPIIRGYCRKGWEV